MPDIAGGTNHQYWDIDLLFAAPDTMEESVVNNKLGNLRSINGTGLGSMDEV